jgi:hypothetical protein
MSEPHDHATVERERPEELAELLRPDIQNQGGSGKNLKQLKWPDAITTATNLRPRGDPSDQLFRAVSVSTLGSSRSSFPAVADSIPIEDGRTAHRRTL